MGAAGSCTGSVRGVVPEEDKAGVQHACAVRMDSMMGANVGMNLCAATVHVELHGTQPSDRDARARHARYPGGRWEVGQGSGSCTPHSGAFGIAAGARLLFQKRCGRMRFDVRSQLNCIADQLESTWQGSSRAACEGYSHCVLHGVDT